MKSFLEGWTASFFGHLVKLGRLFQILGDELHDAIPFHAQFPQSDLQTIPGDIGSRRFRYRDAETGGGKMRPRLRKVMTKISALILRSFCVI